MTLTPERRKLPWTLHAVLRACQFFDVDVSCNGKRNAVWGSVAVH